MSTDRIEKKILLHAPLKRVWRALSDSAEFGSWFGMKFDGPFIPGAVMHSMIVPTTVDAQVAESQKPYEGIAFDITIEHMEPEHIFSFRWHPGAVEPGIDYAVEPTTLVVFQLEEMTDGVLLTISESGFDGIPLERRAKAFATNDEGWNGVLTLIEKHLRHAQ